MPELLVKICGLSTHATMQAALDAGADMVGLNFFPKSPRHVSLADAANLARQAAGEARIVALVVDADDARLHEIHRAVKPDVWQFHGRETPERVAEVRTRYALPVMKVLGVASVADLASIDSYAGVADRILLDAKPPKDAAYPGGHGQPFDWSILEALPPAQPFILAGGLTPENVGEAVRSVRRLGVALGGVDVASGVESAPGIKDPAKIRAFVDNARKA
ncbi:MAG: phosphoribosylanthranilate isomerase [Beijerinckiaceae bacterium]